MDFHEWGVRLQRTTERYLTWRKRRRLAKKERQKQKNVILDWLEAIGSAVLIVLLINQFLLQAYQIPSQSMVSTLEIGDRIFVNKLIYGPELIPGMMKINFPRKPRRAEIIIFENPSYISSGPLMEILQRVIYMVTLSLVDIDRDEFGNPKHHFLIKRAVGIPGDRLRLNQGNVEFLLPGETEWIPEEELQQILGFDYEVRRMFSTSEYGFFENAGIGLALLDSGLPSGRLGVPGQRQHCAKSAVGQGHHRPIRLGGRGYPARYAAGAGGGGPWHRLGRLAARHARAGLCALEQKPGRRGCLRPDARGRTGAPIPEGEIRHDVQAERPRSGQYH